MSSSAHRLALRLGIVAAAIVLLAGCGWFGDDDKGRKVSSFDVKVGDCTNPPKEVKAEIATLNILPCATEHTLEAFSVVRYAADGETTTSTSAPATDSGSTYPGVDVLTTFANSVCAQNFADYVGVPYTDSSLYFTYLVPTPRGWQSGGDRSVICFVTTTGGQTLTASVKNSKR